jgi:hypothetical protein
MVEQWLNIVEGVQHYNTTQLIAVLNLNFSTTQLLTGIPIAKPALLPALALRPPGSHPISLSANIPPPTLSFRAQREI